MVQREWCSWLRVKIGFFERSNLASMNFDIFILFEKLSVSTGVSMSDITLNLQVEDASGGFDPVPDGGGFDDFDGGGFYDDPNEFDDVSSSGHADECDLEAPCCGDANPFCFVDTSIV